MLWFLLFLYSHKPNYQKVIVTTPAPMQVAPAGPTQCRPVMSGKWLVTVCP